MAVHPQLGRSESDAVLCGDGFCWDSCTSVIHSGLSLLVTEVEVRDKSLFGVDDARAALLRGRANDAFGARRLEAVLLIARELVVVPTNLHAMHRQRTELLVGGGRVVHKLSHRKKLTKLCVA